MMQIWRYNSFFYLISKPNLFLLSPEGCKTHPASLLLQNSACSSPLSLTAFSLPFPSFPRFFFFPLCLPLSFFLSLFLSFLHLSFSLSLLVYLSVHQFLSLFLPLLLSHDPL